MSDLADGAQVPFLTTDQMREVDRLMVDVYGILLLQMMENAGRGLASLARERFLAGEPTGKRVLVLCGQGGNGGGGLVAARRLFGWGASVQAWLAAPAGELADVPRHQLGILEHLIVPIHVAGGPVELPPAELVIDAIIGYGLEERPHGPAAELIRAANRIGVPVLALDVPSGIDSTTGRVYDPAIRATAMLTLALPKTGLRGPESREQVGELYVADIGVPPKLYAEPSVGVDVGPIFAESDIVRIW